MSPPSRFSSKSSVGERCPTPRDLLHSSFKVLSLWAPFHFPQRNPYRERCPSPEPSFTYLSGSPSTRALPPSGTSHRVPSERRSISRAHSSFSQSTGKWTPFQFPQRVCYGERCLSPFPRTWCMSLIVDSNSGRVMSCTQRPLPDNKQHSEEISMPLVRFEPTIWASERPQTHALDNAATAIDRAILNNVVCRTSKISNS